MKLQPFMWVATGMRAVDREHFGVAQYYRADDVDARIAALDGALRDALDHVRDGRLQWNELAGRRRGETRQAHEDRLSVHVQRNEDRRELIERIEALL
jgi:hypothetical protein